MVFTIHLGYVCNAGFIHTYTHTLRTTREKNKARKAVEIKLLRHCKKQFDKKHPKRVTWAFKKATKWLFKKRWWRQQDLHWSIHGDSPKLDRAGVAIN